MSTKRATVDDAERLTRALRDATSARILLLRGAVGQENVVAHAVGRARAEDKSVVVLRLDLEGFDDEPKDGLRQYVDQMLDKRGRLEVREAGHEAARLVDALPGKRTSKAGLLSLAMDLEPPFSVLTSTIEATPNDDVDRVIRGVIESLAQGSAVLIHARRAHDLPIGTLRTTLLEAAKSSPEAGPIVLAIGCSLDRLPQTVVPEIGDGLEVESLDLVDLDADTVSKHLASVDSSLDALPRYRDNVRDFVRYSALCGDFVPAELVLGAVGLVEERQEDVLDLVDDFLVEGQPEDQPEDATPPIFDETDVQHRAFPSVSMYRFRDQAICHAIVASMDPRERDEIAESLLRFLEPRLPKVGRAEARLLDAVAGHLSDPVIRVRYRTVLGAWVAIDECAHVGDALHRWLIANEADPNVLWTLASRTRGRWPAPRRILLLERFQALEVHRAGMGSLEEALAEDDDVLAPFHFLLAEALADTGRFADAEPIARRATELVEAATGAGSDPHASTLTLLGTVLHHNQAYDESAATLTRAIEIHDKLHGEKPDLNHAATLHTLGATRLATGDPEAAASCFERSLHIQRAVYGDEPQPNIAVNLWRLAQVDQARGNAKDAARRLDQAIAIANEALGPRHPLTQAMQADRVS